MAGFDRVKQLGDYLVENNIVSMEVLDKALVAQKETGKKLQDILIEEFKISGTRLNTRRYAK